jgi:hypothetical protein
MWHWHSGMISVCLHPILIIVIVIAIFLIIIIVIFTPGSQPFHRLKYDVQQLETMASYEVFRAHLCSVPDPVRIDLALPNPELRRQYRLGSRSCRHEFGKLTLSYTDSDPLTFQKSLL